MTFSQAKVFHEVTWIGSRQISAVLFTHFATKLAINFISHYEVVHEGITYHLQLQHLLAKCDMGICVSEQWVSAQLRACADEPSDTCNIHRNVVPHVSTVCTSFPVDGCGHLTMVTCTALMKSDGLTVLVGPGAGPSWTEPVFCTSVCTSMFTYQTVLPYTCTSHGRQAESLL